MISSVFQEAPEYRSRASPKALISRFGHRHAFTRGGLIFFSSLLRNRWFDSRALKMYGRKGSLASLAFQRSSRTSPIFEPMSREGCFRRLFGRPGVSSNSESVGWFRIKFFFWQTAQSALRTIGCQVVRSEKASNSNILSANTGMLRDKRHLMASIVTKLPDMPAVLVAWRAHAALAASTCLETPHTPSRDRSPLHRPICAYDNTCSRQSGRAIPGGRRVRYVPRSPRRVPEFSGRGWRGLSSGESRKILCRSTR